MIFLPELTKESILFLDANSKDLHVLLIKSEQQGLLISAFNPFKYEICSNAITIVETITWFFITVVVRFCKV